MESKVKEEITLSQSPEEFAFSQGIVNNETITIAKMRLEDSYHKIINILKEYVDMREEQYKIVSLWILGTYFHSQFNSYPYLYFNAMRGSGKTRVLRLISNLSHKGSGKLQNSLTEAGLFRIPKGTTTCIDEFEQISTKEKQALRELLNSAYKKGMEVKRLKKAKIQGEERQISESFELFIPIAMANISGLEEVLSDRALTLILEKSNNPYFTKKIEDFEDNELFLELKRTLRCISVVLCNVVREKNIYRDWNNYISTKYHSEINYINTLYTYINNNYINIQSINKEELFKKIEESEINGRNFELLFPLIMIASVLGEEYLDDSIKIFKELTQSKREEEFAESKDVSFIDFISMLNNYRFEYIQVKELANRFRTFLGESDSEDRWINDKWVGRALKRLNLVGNKKRMASGILVLLNVDKAKEKIKMFKTEEKEEGDSHRGILQGEEASEFVKGE